MFRGPDITPAAWLEIVRRTVSDVLEHAAEPAPDEGALSTDAPAPPDEMPPTRSPGVDPGLVAELRRPPSPAPAPAGGSYPEIRSPGPATLDVRR